MTFEREREYEGTKANTLRSKIEDEVLANAGVNVFKKIFKLIFIKPTPPT